MAKEIKRTAISISLFGEASVGKTCIVGVFIGLEFQEEHLSTVGIEKNNTVIDLETGETVKLKLWDTAGQERFRSISVNTLKNSQAAIVVFDLTNRESFQRVTEWLNKIREYSEKMPIGLFGNKSDLPNRIITQEEIDLLCKKENLVYFETSAKTSTNINEEFVKIATLGNRAFEKEQSKKEPDTPQLEKQQVEVKAAEQAVEPKEIEVEAVVVSDEFEKYDNLHNKVYKASYEEYGDIVFAGIKKFIIAKSGEAKANEGIEIVYADTHKVFLVTYVEELPNGYSIYGLNRHEEDE